MGSERKAQTVAKLRVWGLERKRPRLQTSLRAGRSAFASASEDACATPVAKIIFAKLREQQRIDEADQRACKPQFLLSNSAFSDAKDMILTANDDHATADSGSRHHDFAHWIAR